MDTAVKCNNYGSSLISRQRWRKLFKMSALVNSESAAKDNNDVLVKSINKVIQDSAHYIEYIMLVYL